MLAVDLDPAMKLKPIIEKELKDRRNYLASSVFWGLFSK